MNRDSEIADPRCQTGGMPLRPDPSRVNVIIASAGALGTDSALRRTVQSANSTQQFVFLLCPTSMMEQCSEPRQSPLLNSQE